jgi:hypothetical protein
LERLEVELKGLLGIYFAIDIGVTIKSQAFNHVTCGSEPVAPATVQFNFLLTTERLAHTPELYLLALAQFSITADTEVVRRYFFRIHIHRARC